MGNYLVIGNKSAGSKRLSGITINLMRRATEKPLKADDSNSFKIDRSDVAVVLLYAKMFRDNESAFRRYMEQCQNEGDLYVSQHEGDFEWIHDCFSEYLAWMILHKSRKLRCHWE